jgi:chemotaxis protein CheZ
MPMKGLTATPELRQHLDALRQQSHHQPIAPDEITRIVEQVLSTMGGEITSTDVKLYRELEGLARFIQNARSEIAQVRPDAISSHDIPSATDELDAVVGATEEATGVILDAAEQLENLAGSLPPEQAAVVSDVVTRVYEACNFQDVTGQRITKVVRTLKQIEERVSAMLAAFGDELARMQTDSSAPKYNPAAGPSIAPDQVDLLHGPALPDEAKRQAEIDAILASFG